MYSCLHHHLVLTVPVQTALSTSPRSTNTRQTPAGTASCHDCMPMYVEDTCQSNILFSHTPKNTNTSYRIGNTMGTIVSRSVRQPSSIFCLLILSPGATSLLGAVSFSNSPHDTIGIFVFARHQSQPTKICPCKIFVT